MPKILSFGNREKKLAKVNPFKFIWEWILSLDKFTKLFLIIIVLISIITPSIVTTYLIFSPEAATTTTNTISSSRVSAPLSTQSISPKSVTSGTSIAPQAYVVDAEIINNLNLLNQYRSQNGLGSLTPVQTLTDDAKWYSNDMAGKNYWPDWAYCHDLLGLNFIHCDSSLRDTFQRMAAFGYNFNTWKAENLVAGRATGAEALDVLKASPDHNANMLNPNFNAVGIYRAYNPNSSFGWYWAQEFGGTIDSPVNYPTPAPTAVPILTPTPIPTASIIVSHNPCLIISGTSCTSTVSWSTSYPSAYICTSNGSIETFFSSGKSGSKQITLPTTRTNQFIMRTPASNTCGNGTIVKNTSVLFSTGGDVDCNGVINSVDSLQIQRFVVSLPISNTKCPKGSNTIDTTQADVNHNGRVDTVDSLFILKYVSS